MGLSRLLTGTTIIAITVMSVNFYIQKLQGDKINVLWKESMPIWLSEGLTKLYTINNEKIISRVINDPDMLKDIKAYDDELNQNVDLLMNTLIKSRGGTTTTTRSIKATVTGGSQ